MLFYTTRNILTANREKQNVTLSGRYVIAIS